MVLSEWYGFKVVACNKPEPRPGVYLIAHFETGLKYVGMSYDVAKRILFHRTTSSGTTKLREAIRREGRSAFLVTPLFYSISGVDGLEKVEAQLIAAHDSIRNGYNVLAASRRAGPYGEAFAELVKKGHATPEAKQKRAAILGSAEITKKRGDAIRAAHARPEVKAKLKARKRGNGTAASLKPEAKAKRLATEATPETKARRSAVMKAFHAQPENKEKHRRACIEAGNTPERRAEIARMRRGRIWITDGHSRRAIHATDPIPDGWHRGRALIKPANFTD